MKTYLIELDNSTPIHVQANTKEEALAWCAKWELPVRDIHDDTANVQ
jgi:hypothetical protein